LGRGRKSLNIGGKPRKPLYGRKVYYGEKSQKITTGGVTVNSERKTPLGDLPLRLPHRPKGLAGGQPAFPREGRDHQGGK